MIINKTGRYEFLQEVRLRTSSISAATFPKGMQFTVTQIDDDGRQVIGPSLGDWQYWDLPVKPV
jgi:hypothetical protein